MIDLTSLQKLHEAATAEPWSFESREGGETPCDQPSRIVCNAYQDETPVVCSAPREKEWIGGFGEDAALIVALRNAWPEIRREIEAGRALRNDISTFGHNCTHHPYLACPGCLASEVIAEYDRRARQ